MCATGWGEVGLALARAKTRKGRKISFKAAKSGQKRPKAVGCRSSNLRVGNARLAHNGNHGIILQPTAAPLDLAAGRSWRAAKIGVAVI